MINHGNLSPATHVRIILPTSKHRNARSPQGLMIQSQPCPSHLVQCPVSSNTFPFRDPRLPSLQSPTFDMLRATLQSPFPIADVQFSSIDSNPLRCARRDLSRNPTVFHSPEHGWSAHSVVHWPDQKPCRCVQ